MDGQPWTVETELGPVELRPRQTKHTEQPYTLWEVHGPEGEWLGKIVPAQRQGYLVRLSQSGWYEQERAPQVYPELDEAAKVIGRIHAHRRELAESESNGGSE